MFALNNYLLYTQFFLQSDKIFPVKDFGIQVLFLHSQVRPGYPVGRRCLLNQLHCAVPYLK